MADVIAVTAPAADGAVRRTRKRLAESKASTPLSAPAEGAGAMPQLPVAPYPPVSPQPSEPLGKNAPSQLPPMLAEALAPTPMPLPVAPAASVLPVEGAASALPQALPITSSDNPSQPHTTISIPSVPATVVSTQHLSYGWMVAEGLQWIRSTFGLQSGGIRPLHISGGSLASPADYASSYIQTCAKNFASQIPNASAYANLFSVPVTNPLLGICIGQLFGSIADPYVTKPFIRAHLVDTQTGCYIQPKNKVLPQQLPNAPPVVQPRQQLPHFAAHDSTCTSTTLPGCVPCTGSLPRLFEEGTYVRYQDTVPALNRELDVDMLVALQAAVGDDRMTDLDITQSVLRKTAFQEGYSGAAEAASLIWSEYMVFDIELAEALQPNVAVLLELIDRQQSLPKQQLSEGRGFYRIAWGLLKLVSSSGDANLDLDALLPVGFLPGMGNKTPTTERAAAPVPVSQPSMLRHDVDVAMYSYVGPDWADRVHHGDSVLRRSSTGTTSLAPSPDVSIQYRMRSRQLSGHRLQVAAFPAIAPACRYLYPHDGSTTFTYFSPAGLPMQQLSEYVPWAAANVPQPPDSIMRRQLSLHPAFGRPNFALRLPTDVVLEQPIATGPVVSNPVLTRVEEPTKPALLRSKYARGPNELCLMPDLFVTSVYTGKLGAMSVSFSPDGLLLAVGCAEDITFPIRIVTCDDFREIATLAGHGSLIYQLSWSPSSQWLASASSDGTAKIWHIPHSNKTVAVSGAIRIPARPYTTCLHMPSSYVYAARFHPLQPHLLITGAYDRGVRLWDTGIDPTSGQPVQPAEILDDASALHDGILQGFIGGDPHELAAKGTSSMSHESHVNVVEVSIPQEDPASLRVITADGAGTIMVWMIASNADPAEADSYTLVRCLKPAALRGIPIVSVKMRPGSNQMMVLGHQNILRLFDLGTFGAIRAYPNARCTDSHVELCFSPDGMYVCAGGEDGVLCVWSVDKGELTTPRARVDGRRRALIAYPGIMYGTSWHPDQHLVAVCSFGSAYPTMICGAFSTPTSASD